MRTIKKIVNNRVDLSIIIVSFNTKEITKKCIDSIYVSLKKTPLQFEIIAIDNNSHDGSQQLLKQYKKQKNNFIYIQTNDNLGFGKSNNQAVNDAKGTYILLLNSDTIVVKDAINKLYNFITSRDDVDFAGAKLLNIDETEQPSAGPLFSLPVIFGFLFLKGDHIGLTRYSPKQTIQVGWISGACIICKKDTYHTIQGFDEKIFMYMEEVEMFYRAKKKNLSVWFYPEAKIIHLGSASSNKTYPILQAFRGFLYLYKKHYSSLELYILQSMLKLKSIISISIGQLTNNRYLIETYKQSYEMAAMDR